MEFCVRGFSYMPGSNLDVNLQYIENGELERAWKVNRRQRLKEQEQKIWEEFVKEQDIVQKAYKDPYQFLHDLPDNCLKELMEAEFNKMKDTEADETAKEDAIQEQPNQGEGDHTTEKEAVHTVTFKEENEQPDLVTFHIFDDENEINQSGGEDDQPESPSTVRERCGEDASPHASTHDAPHASTHDAPHMDTCHESDGAGAAAGSTKSSEDVTSVIESSIYCARVQDLRIKLRDEMLAIIASLEVQDVTCAERAEVARRCRRAAEFCARFNRIYMYQLQRQVHNIKRHTSQSLPLAQHTHFQSQMLRVVSLHQNMLQAFQVFHKSFGATSCLRECARALGALCALARDATALCAGAPRPRHLRAAAQLYDDEVVPTCRRLEAALGEFALRVAHLVSCSDVTQTPAPSSTKSKKSKKALTYTKTGTKTSYSTADTQARLSMYSLDTLRAAPPRAPPRDPRTSGASQPRGASSAHAHPSEPDKGAEKAHKKMSGAPLMRAPRRTAPRPAAPRRRPDGDVRTLVEAVHTCESCHAMSRPGSATPRHSPHRHLSRSPLQRSPRSQKTSPRLKHVASPIVKSQRTSPRALSAKKSPRTVTSETPPTVTTKTQIAPVTKIQCAKKQTRNKLVLSPGRSFESPDRTGNFEKTTDQSGKSTDRRNFDKGIDRAGKSTDRSKKVEKHVNRLGRSTDRSRCEKISGRDRDNDGLDPKNTAKIREHNNDKGSKVDKSVDKDVGNEVNNDDADNDNNSGDGRDRIDKDIVCGKVDRLGHIGNPGKEDNTGREFSGVKELTDYDDDYSKCYAREVDEEKNEKGRSAVNRQPSPARCDVTRLLRQLCSGEPAGLNTEKVTGAKNAQLVCMRGGSPPLQPSTPQLLRILEESIQKASPRAARAHDPLRHRLSFNIPERTASRAFRYRTQFVQHMLASPLYANSALGEPWKTIRSVSDTIIDELLTNIAKEMELSHVMHEMYKCETN